MRRRVGVRVRLARSLARSLARRLRLSVRGYIIERANFQGLPRASAIPSRAKRPHLHVTTPRESETPRPCKAAVAHARAELRRACVTIFATRISKAENAINPWRSRKPDRAGFRSSIFRDSSKVDLSHINIEKTST